MPLALVRVIVPLPFRARIAQGCAALGLCLGLCPAPASAQPPPDQPSTGQVTPPEIELNLINLPTTMTVRRHRSYFRLTHRFARDLRAGDFGNLAEDLFSLDNGAVIALEYRYGVTRNLEAGVHRSSLSKTIEFFGRYEALRQSDSSPVSLTVLASIEGLSNLHENRQPGIAATVSRVLNPAIVVYATPAFIAHTKAADFLSGHDHDHDLPGAEEDEHALHKHTAILGLGTRIRFRPTAYLVGEYSPRLAGHDPGRGVWGVAVEKLTRGHTLQLNFTNAFATTMGQLARGGSTHDIYLGFNLTRRF